MDMEQVQKGRLAVISSQLVVLALISILLVALGLFAWDRLPVETWLSEVTYFSIKEVRLSVSWPLTPEKVKSWLPRLEGRNLLLVQPEKFLPLLEGKPWVGAVTFKKEYPDRLQISVEGKTAKAILVEQGQAYYVDSQGQRIDRVSGAYSRALDLPTLSCGAEGWARWDVSKVIALLQELPKIWKNAYQVSQLVVDEYPYLRVYLSSPRVEILLDLEHWNNELAQVPSLLHTGLPQLKQVRKINLVFPKKAIVSASLSK